MTRIYWYASREGHTSVVVCAEHDTDMPQEGLIEVDETTLPCDHCPTQPEVHDEVQ